MAVFKIRGVKNNDPSDPYADAKPSMGARMGAYFGMSKEERSQARQDRNDAISDRLGEIKSAGKNIASGIRKAAGNRFNNGKQFIGEHKGIDFFNDNKGMFQRGKFVGRQNVDPSQNAVPSVAPTVNAQPGQQQAVAAATNDNVNKQTIAQQVANVGNEPPGTDMNVRQDTGENVPLVGNLLAMKVSDPSQIPQEHVNTLQAFLRDEGYNLGTTGANNDGVDGNWGKRSTAALTDWLSKHNPAFQQSSNVNDPPPPSNTAGGMDYLQPDQQVNTKKSVYDPRSPLANL